MTILTLGSVLLGAVLGRFFKVWILIPTGAVAVMAAFARAIYQDAGLLRAFLECAVLMTCLQIGYVSGVFSHSLLGKLQQFGTRRSTRPPPASMAASRHWHFF